MVVFVLYLHVQVHTCMHVCAISTNMWCSTSLHVFLSLSTYCCIFEPLLVTQVECTCAYMYMYMYIHVSTGTRRSLNGH